MVKALTAAGTVGGKKKRLSLTLKSDSSGNKASSDTKDANQNLLYDMVEVMLDSHEHILPMWNHLQKRLQDGTKVFGDDCFKKLSSIYATDKAGYCGPWLCARSDFSGEDLAKLEKDWHVDAIEILQHYALQLPRHLRVLEACRSKRIATRIRSKRIAEIGDHMKTLKQRMGIIGIAKDLKFEKLSVARYTFKFNSQDQLEEIKHINGEACAIDPKEVLCSKKARFQKLYSDMEATYAMPPLYKEVLLHEYFPGGDGPHHYQQFTGTHAHKHWNTYVEEAVAAFKAEDLAAAGDSSKAEECEKVLATASKNRKKALSEASRSAAKQKSASRNAVTTMTIVG